MVEVLGLEAVCVFVIFVRILLFFYMVFTHPLYRVGEADFVSRWNARRFWGGALAMMMDLHRCHVTLSDYGRRGGLSMRSRMELLHYIPLHHIYYRCCCCCLAVIRARARVHTYIHI